MKQSQSNAQPNTDLQAALTDEDLDTVVGGKVRPKPSSLFGDDLGVLRAKEGSKQAENNGKSSQG
ncbi:MAG: hypothetical protein AAGB01_03820 [Cyanobacteria bacterium P01_F01_bin.42]